MSTTANEPAPSGQATLDGPAAAALISAGVGAFVLGLMTTLNEASSGIHDFLDFYDRVGPLSGKTIIASIAYFAALAVLAVMWSSRSLALKTVVWVTAILIVLGLIGTFPEFFVLFA